MFRNIYDYEVVLDKWNHQQMIISIRTDVDEYDKYYIDIKKFLFVVKYTIRKDSFNGEIIKSSINYLMVYIFSSINKLCTLWLDYKLRKAILIQFYDEFKSFPRVDITNHIFATDIKLTYFPNSSDVGCQVDFVVNSKKYSIWGNGRQCYFGHTSQAGYITSLRDLVYFFNDVTTRQESLQRLIRYFYINNFLDKKFSFELIDCRIERLLFTRNGISFFECQQYNKHCFEVYCMFKNKKISLYDVAEENIDEREMKIDRELSFNDTFYMRKKQINLNSVYMVTDISVSTTKLNLCLIQFNVFKNKDYFQTFTFVMFNNEVHTYQKDDRIFDSQIVNQQSFKIVNPFTDSLNAALSIFTVNNLLLTDEMTDKNLKEELMTGSFTRA